MAVTLAALASRLQSAVPARDGVPSAGDYEQHVKDAVLQLATDVPLVRLGTLAVVSGTATYELASDFLFLIELEGLASTDNIIISDAGLVPMPREWEEEFYVEDTEITFDPTPTYTLSRDYRYAALYELTGVDPDETYARLNQNGARIALLYAQYLAVMQQANAVAGDGWRYQIGDEMVDKSNQGRGMASQAQGLLTQYQGLIQSQKGYGRVARYSVLGT